MDANPVVANAMSKRAKKKDTSGPGIDELESKSDSHQTESRNGMDNGTAQESFYVKDLQKNIRSINKKLTAMHKLDSVIAENPNMSLDDLVASKKINADQKTQALKKPHLQANLAQLEDQLVQVRKYEEDFKRQFATERAQLESAHKAELTKMRSEAANNANAELRRGTRERLLILSKFLRAAAARRQIDDDDSEDGKAFEGVLLLLYGGDTAAVDAAEKLIGGDSASVTSTEGNKLAVTYGRVKQLSLEHGPFASDDATTAEIGDTSHGFSSQQTDPTVSYATFTETEVETKTDGDTSKTDNIAVPPQSMVDLDAANASAQDSWERDVVAPEGTLAESWVSVSRELQETELTPNATSTSTTTQAWADEPQMPMRASDSFVDPSTSLNDGFSEVHHGRGGRGRNGFGVDHRGGGGRGRGMGRGDGGRGRGAFRGERGRPRPRASRGREMV